MSTHQTRGEIYLMPRTDAQRRARQKYYAERYAYLRIRPKFEDDERIRKHAACRGESLTHFMLRAADTQMEIDLSERK
jgi:uncharacterized protein (DUF1778 family)